MNDEGTTEHLVSDYDDLPPLIPAVEVDMVVDDTPIVLNDDEPSEETAKDEEIETKSYDEELKESGLCEADIAYFNRAYADLEPVKYIRMHCTSCDRHLGTAPNQLSNRYEHPLLKVLICEDCFQFYSSGDFEKDEDGSELYCRWCGEGGQVFCCTTCPFVFCKRCIIRNLGRATASLIQNSDNWLCFACSPDQISRHRANFWAIQKYSAELIRKHEGCPEDIAELNLDSNLCCNRLKRTDPPNKSKSTAVPPNKRRKVEPVLPKSAAKKDATWKKMYTNIINPEEPEAEVICTPDIIPIDDSPPNSPSTRSPPPLVACKAPAVPVKIRLNSKNPNHLNLLQDQLKKTFSQRVFITPSSKLMPNHANKNNDHSGQVSSPLGNKNFKIFLKKPPAMNSTMIVNPVSNNVASSSSSSSSGPVLERHPNDWFDKAVVHCAEVTRYITTKMAALSDVHARAHRSTKLMDELHNTIQTYLYVAIEKLHIVKTTMQNNFDEEWKNDQVVNPFAASSSALTSKPEPKTRGRRKRRKRFDSDNSDDDDSDDEDIIFDMDVVNESDEESSDEYTPRTSQSQKLTKHIPIPSPETICIDTDSEDELHKTNANDINEDVEEIQSPLVILSQSKDDDVTTNTHSTKTDENSDSNHSIPKTDDDNTQNQTPDADETVQLDLEDEISGNIVLRSPNKNITTFRDEFSKFISRTEPKDCEDELDSQEDDHDDSSPDTDTNTTAEPGNDDSSQDKGKNTNGDMDNDDSSQDKGKNTNVDTDNDDSSRDKDKKTSEDSNSSVKDDLPTENNTVESCNEDGLGQKESLIEEQDKDENDINEDGLESKKSLDKDENDINKDETSRDIVSENNEVDHNCSDVTTKNHIKINELNSKRASLDAPLEKSDDLLPFVLDMVGPVDNGALSLPPGGVLTDFLSTELKNCATKSLDNEELDNELLALKQIAENCVNTATDMKNSAECQG